jgi:predicted RNase H-like HicB family nuclease
MNLRKDLGFDEILDNTYAMYIIDEDGNIFCRVFGSSLDECEKNADKILELNYII